VAAITEIPVSGDYRSIVAKIKSAEPMPLVLALLQNGENQKFLKQAKALKLHVPIYATNNLVEELLVLPDFSWPDEITAFEYNYITDRSHPFLAAHRERFGTEADITAPRAYDNVYLLAEALKCSALKMEVLSRCLAESDYEGVTGCLQFDASHNILHGAKLSRLVRVKGGKVQAGQ